MESPLAIARFFLEKSGQKDKMTPMKVLKMVYLAHGWHLGITGKPLIGDLVEAWKYGPVIPSLYYHFRRFGRNTIPRNEVFSLAKIEDEQRLSTFLNHIWKLYSSYSGLQLSTLTHREGTPWEKVWHKQGGKEQYGVVIPNELIEEYYKKKIKG